ncbi:MAG: AbrB/MazE/SpoVT family DNA-binding domain-containing protein [Chloroflexi bacterium]|nr:AbrB/MazE/SpoVT family DNA-binding domain-containing protein [Chloroflexota bacterium]
MARYVTTVTEKGQVTIPGELRKALNIEAKDKVAFEMVDGELRLLPIKSTLLAGFGSVRPLHSPEDFQAIRRIVEEEMAEEAAREGR